MAHIQKVILLVLIVPLALFPGGLISYDILFATSRYQGSIWMPFALSFLGIGSFIFHVKTNKFYKLSKNNTDLPKVDIMFWIMDIAFGMAYIALSFWMFYLTYLSTTKEDFLLMILINLPMFVIGAWIVFEAFYLNKLIQIHRYAHRHSEIDDIMGDVGE